MITPFDFILGAGAVAGLAVLCLIGVMLPGDPDDPDTDDEMRVRSWLTEADLDDEDDDELDFVRVDHGVIP